MKYILILKTGKVMVFTIKECAKMYESIYGGTLVSTIDNEENVKRILENV
jgi:hypothetical protein